MGQVLHGCATTTEAVRRAIQHSQESLMSLARRYGINPKTVAKWKKRSSVGEPADGDRKKQSRRCYRSRTRRSSLPSAGTRSRWTIACMPCRRRSRTDAIVAAPLPCNVTASLDCPMSTATSPTRASSSPIRSATSRRDNRTYAGIVISRRAVGSAFERRLISASNPAIWPSSAVKVLTSNFRITRALPGREDCGSSTRATGVATCVMPCGKRWPYSNRCPRSALTLGTMMPSGGVDLGLNALGSLCPDGD
jgi:hypothetical protein